MVLTSIGLHLYVNDRVFSEDVKHISTLLLYWWNLSPYFVLGSSLLRMEWSNLDYIESTMAVVNVAIWLQAPVALRKMLSDQNI